MTHVGYVLGGYAATAAVLVAYSAWVRARGRALSSLLAPERPPEAGGAPDRGRPAP